MKISYKWLKEYVDLAVSPEELAEALPMIGLEIDDIEKKGIPKIDNLVVGEVLTKEQHPNADRLSVCQVKQRNGEIAHIVCGAQNFNVGDKVPLALVGAVLPGGFEIKKSELRGVPSEGMMCSAKELGLGEDHSGLMILDNSLEAGILINDVMSEGDTVFELEVTSNRGDCLSQVGVAREIAAYYNIPLRTHPSNVEVPEASAPTSESLIQSLEVQSNLCPYYTAISIQGVQVGPSPKWLKEALENVGLRSINNVVDVTNYVLWEYGQPLHAFDANKIAGKKIIVRNANDGEKIKTLDEVERTLNPEMLVIADAEKPLVIAGVMGSIDAEVDMETVDILLESAYFKPGSIRGTSRKLNLSTDSSYRFSRDVDPVMVRIASLRAADLILEVAGGKVVGPSVVYGEPGPSGREIRITEEYVTRILGFSISKADIEDVCHRLGFSVVSINDEMVVTVPSYRREVDRPIDLVEEILRIHGTSNIPDARVSFMATGEEDDAIAVKLGKVRTFLAANHFQECQNYTLRNGKEVEQWFGDENASGLALHNPLTVDQSHVRASLLPGLLNNLQYNISNGNSPRALFEVGRVFRSEGGKVSELIAVTFLITQETLQRSWLGREGLDFFSVKNLTESVLMELGIEPKRIQYGVKTTSALWQEVHSSSYGSVTREQIEVSLGLLNLKSLKEWDVKDPVFGAEIILQPKQLMKAAKVVSFQPITSYPVMTKDLALVVNQDVLAASVQRDLEKIGKKSTGKDFEVTSVEPFDFYQGEGLEEGKKSLAYAITFRSPSRTLKDKEVNEAFDKIQAEIAQKTQYTVR
jgi:phenylalanyl-tRNA synthetase beta chain